MVFCKPRHSSCFCCFQDLFGDDHNKNGFQMFDSSKYHSQDLIFKDATVQAVPVREKTTYLDWLGPDYVMALEGMLSQQCSGAGRGAGHVSALEITSLKSPETRPASWGWGGNQNSEKVEGYPRSE